MTANHTAYEATVKAAQATKQSSVIVAETARQGTIAASSSHVGYWCGKGGAGESAYQAAVIAANNAKQAAVLAAEQTKQATEAVAKDLLRSQGEIP
jgi:NAD(P)H-hydrate repair Nnr-like enzyme with NAD(P)H-hydrate epimerase domain